ncbi:hypothetical protein FB45DRAFT_872828 [Roridomyces roridus]|uniref:Uncharacterized protein n=1 Tax=Roridomyces roridus TaxID=1738132 RepID=A0AAD7BDC0_9AGAR|nr:hypothetical protein FB45DRAFT_872828 [Roridomyces roridus]
MSYGPGCLDSFTPIKDLESCGCRTISNPHWAEGYASVGQKAELNRCAGLGNKPVDFFYFVWCARKQCSLNDGSIEGAQECLERLQLTYVDVIFTSLTLWLSLTLSICSCTHWART